MRIYIFLMTLFLFSCQEASNNLFQNVIKDFETTVVATHLKNFKNSPKDSVTHYFEAYANQYLELCKDSTQAAKLNEYFTKIDYTTDDGRRKLYFCFALHARVNNKPFSDDIIINDCYDELCREQFRQFEEEKKYYHSNTIKK
jgi:hypothetical protein